MVASASAAKKAWKQPLSTGLDLYSRQVFIYLDLILIHMSLNRLPV